MTKQQELMTAVLDETLEYYAGHRRANNNGSCNYLDPTTKAMCAVGRCIEPKVLKKYFSVLNTAGAVDDMEEFIQEDSAFKLQSIDDILMPKYRGLSMGFWLQIQDLHDSEDYWQPYRKVKNKITPKGKEAVDKIRRNIERYPEVYA